MQKAKIIAKLSMFLAENAAVDSSIGFGQRGYGRKPHAVQGAGQGSAE